MEYFRKLSCKIIEMKNALLLLITIFMFGCTQDRPTVIQNIPLSNNVKTYNYLALGDSYTIGESVCDTCRFPEQLKAAIQMDENIEINLNIIAQTGWTTTNLFNAIISRNPTNNQDIVTLLIGVNNQYQQKPFSVYETEFPQLVQKAIALAKDDKTNVIVISIPDYRYTPFGNGSQNPNISDEIDQYNLFALNYCAQNNIAFINITDITRNGLDDPSLVANDGLHPSQIAYGKFVERMLPFAIERLND